MSIVGRCEFCGEKYPYRLLPFWDWSGRVRFLFCSPWCRDRASDALGVVMIDEVTKTRRPVRP